MSDGFKILHYNNSEHLNESVSNWTFWSMRITLYLKGSKLWPYVSATLNRPDDGETEKLARWEEIDAQALSTILH